MRLLRAATLTVADPEATARRYAEWLDYAVVERGAVDAALAASWGTPASVGRPFVLCRPASGADIFLRFVAGEPPADYRPLRTYGWAAVEICVQDTPAVNDRMQRSPFTIIGEPKALEGLPTIFPMQVRGPDQEIVYLTQINGDLPDQDLPRARSLIDHLFILVLACSDMDASARWLEQALRLQAGRTIELVYSMLNDAFDLPKDRRHALATLVHGRDVFLEVDQYPPEATARPTRAGELPPGVALCTLLHPEFDSLGGWIAPPLARPGALYGGRRSGALRGPDGVLVEVVEA